MRLAISSAMFGAALLSGQAFAQSPMDATGMWLTEDGRAKIRIEHCDGNKICGFVAWMKDPLTDKGQPRTDIHNPDPAKRSRPSLGLELMIGLAPDDDNNYAGEIYNADNGKTYSVTLAVEKADELHVKGCMMRLLCGSQTWARVADAGAPGGKVASTATKPAKASAHHEAQAPTP